MQLLRCFTPKGKRKRMFVDEEPSEEDGSLKMAKKARKQSGSAKRRLEETNSVNDVLKKLTGGLRGGGVFVCESKTALPESILHTTSLTALTSVFSSSNGLDQPKELCPKLVISTVTHEEKQLYWGRKDIPLCGAGEDCHARCFHGSALCGALSIYLYPEEQMLYERNGACPQLKSQWKATSPRFCLLCYRLMAHTTKLACDASAGKSKIGSLKGSIVPPFTNLVDVPDGYRLSAMGVTPSDICMAGAVYICSVTKGLEVKYNHLKKMWFIEQTPEIVYTVAHNEPFL